MYSIAEGSDIKHTTAEHKVMVKCYLDSHAETWWLLEEKAQGFKELQVKSARRIR